MREVTVSDVEVLAVRGAAPPEAEFHGQTRPMDLYRALPRPGAGSPARDRRGSMEALYLRVRCEPGVEGLYGPIDREAAWVVVDLLGDFVVGEDALAGTIVWDKMGRFDRHARHGHFKMAISAIDNALWDVRGKVFGAPVWQLLGGGARRTLPAYASTLGASQEPGEVERTARELADEGYAGQKWFPFHGPADGWDGMTRNIELVERLRDTLGPGGRIMFDAWTSWDLAYARSWAQAVEHLRPAWLEEPFSPAHDTLYAELHRQTRIPLAAGEHLYDRREVLNFLRDGGIAVLQADPEWCGGVTELTRMCAVAETFGVPLIPHGHGLHAAIHVVASQSPETCPMVEYLYRFIPRRHHFEADPPVPIGGSFPLPTEPGFGIELDDSKIEHRGPWDPAGRS